MTSKDSSLAGNIRRLREAAGLSQAELAEALTAAGVPGIYPQTITKLEGGLRTLKFTEGVPLATILGVRASDLLELGEEAAVASRWAHEVGRLVGEFRKASEESEQLAAKAAETRAKLEVLMSSPPSLKGLDSETADFIRAGMVNVRKTLGIDAEIDHGFDDVDRGAHKLFVEHMERDSRWREQAWAEEQAAYPDAVREARPGEESDHGINQEAP